MKNRDEQFNAVFAKIDAILAQQNRGDAGRDMRESLQRIEEGILKLGDIIREQQHELHFLKKQGP